MVYSDASLHNKTVKFPCLYRGYNALKISFPFSAMFVMVRVLELFCGTKSIGRHCHTVGYTVYSIDIDPKCAPDVVTDIMKWDYKVFPPGFFQIIWASPPCTHYSVLRTTGGPRDIEGANKIVMRTLEIIRYFQPHVWFMENPATGYLKDQSFMKGLPYIDVHYCKYGYPYRKWTRIWTNLEGFTPKLCKNDCDALVEDKVSGCLRHQGTFGGIYPGVPLHQRYSIPPSLVSEMFRYAKRMMETVPPSPPMDIEVEHEIVRLKEKQGELLGVFLKHSHQEFVE